MIQTCFLIGFSVYLASASISNNFLWKTSWWYFPLGICLTVAGSVAWLMIAKHENSSSRIMMLGMYWDVMLTLVYILVPLVFFNAEATKMQYFGIFLVIAGIVLTKVRL